MGLAPPLGPQHLTLVSLVVSAKFETVLFSWFLWIIQIIFALWKWKPHSLFFVQIVRGLEMKWLELCMYHCRNCSIKTAIFVRVKLEVNYRQRLRELINSPLYFQARPEMEEYVNATLCQHHISSRGKGKGCPWTEELGTSVTWIGEICSNNAWKRRCFGWQHVHFQSGNQGKSSLKPHWRKKSNRELGRTLVVVIVGTSKSISKSLALWPWDLKQTLKCP